MSKKQKQLLIEYAKRLKKKEYQIDPIKWQVERFGEPVTNWYWDKWGEAYEGHIWDGTQNPFATAIQALANKKWVGIESATSTGKTFTLPRIIFWFLDNFENSLVVSTAPKQGQLKEILWSEVGRAFKKFKKIRPKAQLLSLKVVVDSSKKLYLEEDDNDSVGWKAIGVVSGVGAGEESATKMQGFHNENMLFVLEEAAGIDPAVLKAIVNTCTASNNLIIAVGNPDSQLDSLHQFCEYKRTEHIVVSAYDHPNIVLDDEVIHGAVSKSSIDFRKDEYGEDSNFFKSRIRGIAPRESTNSLFKDEVLNRCFASHETFVINENLKQKSYNAVGVDVANSIGGDKGCVCYGTGNRLKHLQEFSCPNSNYLAYNLVLNDLEILKKSQGLNFDYNPVYGIPKLTDFQVNDYCIGVDAVGVGAGTLNTLEELKINVTGLHGGAFKDAYIKDNQGKYLYEFENIRAQMYYQAMLDLLGNEIVIDIPEKIFKALKKELMIIEYELSNNLIKIEPKEKIKKKLGGKSPNYADSFVYWNWMRRGWYIRQSWTN